MYVTIINRKRACIMDSQLSEFGINIITMLMFGLLAVVSAVMVKTDKNPPIGWYLNLFIGLFGIMGTMFYGLFCM